MGILRPFEAFEAPFVLTLRSLRSLRPQPSKPSKPSSSPFEASKPSSLQHPPPPAPARETLLSGGGLTEEPATSEQRSVWRLQRSLRAFLPFLDRLRFPDDLWGFRTPGGQDRMIASSRLCWMKTSTHPASTSSSASTSSTAGHRSAESGQGLGVGLRLEPITWHTRRWEDE